MVESPAPEVSNDGIEVLSFEHLPETAAFLQAIKDAGFIIEITVEGKGIRWTGYHKDNPEQKTAGFIELGNS